MYLGTQGVIPYDGSVNDQNSGVISGYCLIDIWALVLWPAGQ